MPKLYTTEGFQKNNMCTIEDKKLILAAVETGCLKIFNCGSSLAVQWLGLGTFTAVAQVQSLDGGLGCHKPGGTVRK